MQVQHLFHAADSAAQTLHRRITPTTAQREQQQERWNDLRDYLVNDLAEKTGLPIRSWLQGSYKFGTQIRPVKINEEFDIDLGIYFSWPGAPDDGALDPKELKVLVRQSLIAYAEEAEDDVVEVFQQPKERCERIRFSGNFHIDMPCYHLDADARCLATETLGWEDSDPKAIHSWFQDLYDVDDTAQVRRLIRYFKAWAILHLETPPPSILITVLVAEAYQTLSNAEAASDDVALLNLSQIIADRLEEDADVPNPAQPNEGLNRLTPEQLQVFIEQLRHLEGLARSALDAASEAEAAHHWTMAFHHFFPAPREAMDASGNQALVPVVFDPQVGVRAVPKGSTHMFQGVNQIGPIPKNCAITFTLTNAHELPPGAQMRWIVRNEGAEAEAINDLGHWGAQGPVATENSAYRGTHYMDVAVTSAFGAMLGYRRVPVRIAGIPMPLRNPKKPGWTRFRQK